MNLKTVTTFCGDRGHFVTLFCTWVCHQQPFAGYVEPSKSADTEMNCLEPIGLIPLKYPTDGIATLEFWKRT